MHNLLVEIGNTSLKAAWSEGTTLGKTYRYQGEKAMGYLHNIVEKERPEVITVASAKILSQQEIDELERMCAHLIVLDGAHTELLLKKNLPEDLSFDRAAYIIATAFLFKGKSCTIFDFGTTLTVDFIDSNGKYLGGNVSPGCRTRFKSLERYSKSLPLVETPQGIMPEGTTLKSSIESGVISGIMFEIEGYGRKRPENINVFTGGDAIYFAKKMKSSIFVVSNLVLIGLALITDDYVKKDLK